MQSRHRGARVPNISGGSDLASAKAGQSQPKCTVCAETIAGGEVVIFNHGELVHVDCHRDRPLSGRRRLSRAMQWPR
jgi:hypothetical protein